MLTSKSLLECVDLIASSSKLVLELEDSIEFILIRLQVLLLRSCWTQPRHLVKRLGVLAPIAGYRSFFSNMRALRRYPSILV